MFVHFLLKILLFEDEKFNLSIKILFIKKSSKVYTSEKRNTSEKKTKYIKEMGDESIKREIRNKREKIRNVGI